jgi:hypothetical protein
MAGPETPSSFTVRAVRMSGFDVGADGVVGEGEVEPLACEVADTFGAAAEIARSLAATYGYPQELLLSQMEFAEQCCTGKFGSVLGFHFASFSLLGSPDSSVDIFIEAHPSYHRSFSALLDIRLPDDGQFAQAAGAWLEHASRVLGADLWEQLHRSLPLAEQAEWNHPHGEPHGVWGSVTVLPRGGQQQATGHHPYSPESFEWMLTELANRPLSAGFQLRQLDEAGVPYEGSGKLAVAVAVEEDQPEWVQLCAGSTLFGAEHDPMRPQVSQRWADVLREMAERVDASFGHLCDDASAEGTALDATLFRGGEVESMLQGRRVLRGYSWVTVCPAELARRLGGRSALAATGAFAVVDQLPHGGVWLQATPDFASYDQRAVREVFKALAPVLPAGKPERDPFDDRPRRLVWEDAADYR